MSKIERKNKCWIKYAGALAVIFVTVFIISTNKALAAPDATIYYQGKLTNTTDVAVADGSYDFKFRIYDDPSGGSCLWSAQGDCSTPTAKSVSVSKGIFSTALGEGGDNALDLDFNSNYWLEVTVGSDSPMNVRKKINAAGYALNSTRLDGGTWEAPGTIGAGTPNSAVFTTLDSNDTTNLATGAGSTVAIGNSTGAATLASGGTSSWTNTAGDLTISTGASGILALTSVGALNLSGTSLVVDTSATSDTINIEQGTYDSILSFTQPGAATQTYTFATGGTVATSANNLSIFAATTSAQLSGVLTDENTIGGYMTDVMTTAGDLIYAGASGVPARLAGSSTNGWVLTYNTGTNAPEWEVGGSHTQNTDTGTSGTTFTIGDASTTFTIDTATTNDTINIEQGTYDSILSFTQPGAATQTYTFATGGTVYTSGNIGTVDHGSLTGLGDDDHSIYALLAGRGSGGQTLIGGTGTTDDLILRTTAGIGASGADMIFQTGDNGGTEAMKITYDGNIRMAKNFGILESTGATYYTIFQSGDQADNITYTLPTSSSTGLLKNTAGVWSWEAKITDAELPDINYRLPYAGIDDLNAITDNGNGTITIPANTGNFLVDSGSGIQHFDISAGTNLALADDVTSYIVANYNSGSPVFEVITNGDLIDYIMYLPYAEAFKRAGSNSLHVQISPMMGHGEIEMHHERVARTDRYARESGLDSISVDSSLNITAGGGVAWSVNYPYTIPAVTTATRQFQMLHVASVWAVSPASHTSPVINNTQYDNGTNATTLTDNYWTINYIYRGIEDQDHMYTVLGNAEYATSDLAKASGIIGDLPELITSHAMLIGRVIVQKNATSNYIIEGSFTDRFAGASPVSSHSALSGLSADDHTQYALSAGRSSGQTLTGGTGAGENLTFQTTSDGSKGSYIFSELGSGLVLSTSGTLSAVANTLHTQNTDTGTTGVSFIVGSSTNSTTTDTFLQFGSTGPETLTFDGDSTDNFLLSDDLSITGGLTATTDLVSNTQVKILENGGTPTLYGIFDVGDLTSADKTYTFPDVSGTVAVAATSTTATQALFATATAGAPAFRGIAAGDLPTITPAIGGTGVANGTNNTITFTGNYTLGLTLSGATAVTLPTSGTLATTSQIISAHSGLTGLTTGDDHTQYALLAGRGSGGQTLIGGTGTTDDLILRTTASGSAAAGADMIFQTGNNGAIEAMRIFYDGDMAIGAATDHDVKLEITDTAEQLRLGYDVDSYIKFTTASDSKLTLETAEGTQSMITVGKGTAQDAGVSFDGNTNDYYAGMDDTDDAFHIGVGQAIGTTPYITLLSNGKVGIGDITPSYGGLVVANGVTIGSDANANALVDDATNGAGSTVLYIGQNTINTTAPSDKRLKHNIVGTDLRLAQLLKLNVVDFQYIPGFTTDQSLHNGLIAQEVESVYPYAVSVRSDGYKMVNYENIIPLLIKSLQEQQGEILEMEKLNASLEDGSLALETRITKVEDLVKKLEVQGLTLETKMSAVNNTVSDQQAAIAKIESQLASLTQDQTAPETTSLEISSQDNSLPMSDLFEASQPQAVTLNLGQMESAGALVIGTPVEFQGPAVFKAIVEFFDRVIFRNDVQFAGQVQFNQDTAGYALVQEGQDNVVIAFAKEYATPPVVNASLSLQQIEDAEVRQAAEELLLLSDVNFIITNVTTKGFEIRINQSAMSQVPFSWQALSVQDAKTSSEKIADDSSNQATTEASGTGAELPAENLPTISEINPPVEADAPIIETAEEFLSEPASSTEVSQLSVETNQATN